MSKPDPTKPVKAIAAGVVFVAGWATTALADGIVTGQEWSAGIVGLIVSVGAVYGLKNPQVP
jgi:hypothetical protein